MHSHDIRGQLDFNLIRPTPLSVYEKFFILAGTRTGQRMLDVCCGSGDISIKLLQMTSSPPKLYLLDESLKQLQRAWQALGSTNIFICGSVLNIPLPDNYFDVVTIKFGVHEFPQEMQPLLFQELYRVLKPKGVLAVWEYAFDEVTQPLAALITRKKDELAEFTDLAKNRFFPSVEQLFELFLVAGFNPAQAEFLSVPVSAKSRKTELVIREAGGLSEANENLAENRLKKLIQFMEATVPLNLWQRLGITRTQDDINYQNPLVLMVSSAHKNPKTGRIKVR